MIRDRIVFGTSSQKVREKLITEGEKLTLDKAIQIAQSYEYSQEQLKTMSAQEAAVHHVSRRESNRPNRSKGNQGRQLKHTPMESRDRGKFSKEQPQKTKETECDKCGYNHIRSAKCPAQGQQCTNCKKWNHFAKKCRSRKVNELVIPESDTEFYTECIETNHRSDQAFCTLLLGQKHTPVRFKLDTGSQVNILPNHVYSSLGSPYGLSKTDQKLSAYNDHPLHTLGCTSLETSYKGQTLDTAFHVVETNSSPILGMRACLDHSLIQLVYSCDVSTPPGNTKVKGQSTKTMGQPPKSTSQPMLDTDRVLSEFSEVFEGIGLFPGECTIHTDPSIPPVIHPPRRVPLALQDKLRSELDQMESQAIICKVTEPTEWFSSLVVVEKPNGKLRVCLDPNTTGRKIYCECHFLLSITANYCPCTVSADNYCRLLSLLLSVLRITVIYCAFYCECCDLLSFTVLVLSLLQITVIYCPYRSPRASSGIAPQTDYIR